MNPETIQHTLTGDFWIQKLKDATYHPVGRTGLPKASSGSVGEIVLPIDNALAGQVHAASKGSEVSAFLIYMAALNIVLMKYTGQNDIVITTTAPADAEEDASATLFFFRQMIDPSSHPRNLLNSLLQDLNASYGYRKLDYSNFLNRFRQEGGDPKVLSRAGFIMDKVNRRNSLIDKCEILVTVAEPAAGPVLKVQYREECYLSEDMRHFAQNYIYALTEMLSGKQIPVGDIDILSPEEKKRLLETYNATSASYPAGTTIVELIAHWGNATPEHEAVYFAGISLTYGELNRKSNQLARYLRNEFGIGPGKGVGLMMDKSCEAITGILAILKAGSFYVPVDPSLPQERILHMAEDAGLSAMLIQSEYLNRAEGYKGGLFAMDIQLDLPGVSDSPVEILHTGKDLAYVIYTSGSTGKPKGVMIEHEGVVNLAYDHIRKLSITSRDRILQFFSLSFDASVLDIIMALVPGATLVLAGKAEVSDSTTFTSYVEEAGVTLMTVTPSYLRTLHQAPMEGVRTIITGGEAVVKEDALFYACSRKFYNAYGPSEATVNTSLFEVDKNFDYDRIPIGTPGSNKKVYILDDALRLVPEGVTGEICIAGAGLARGYLHDEALTKEKFVPNPYEKGTLLYRTGDLGRWLPGGNLDFCGRKDHQVKVRGYRIELGEIEKVLKEHPAVKEAVVIRWEDQTGDCCLVGYFQPKEAVEESELIRHLNERLPAYMVPSSLKEVAAFTMTRNGKLDRDALPSPETFIRDRQSSCEPPANQTEARLLEIWKEVLGVESIGVTDDFFRLGGESLKGIRVINKIQDWLGEVVHVALLFEAPTVRQLAAKLKEREQASKGRLDDGKVERVRNAVPALKPLGTSHQRNRRAVFILSPPRSGSTLLRVILGGHPALFAPPELELLGFDDLQQRRDALAGKFSFYTEGVTRAVMELKQCDAMQAKQLMETLEAQATSVSAFYGMMQEWLGERILVDKTPSYAMSPEMLERAEAYFEDALYIHLRRHPLGMIRSFEEARADQIFRYNDGLSSRELGEAAWLISQQNITAFLDRIPERRKCLVRFEDLVSDPEHTVQELCRFLELPYEEKMLQVYGSQEGKMTDGIFAESKMIGDVKFFTHNTITPSVKDAWKNKYPVNFLSASTRTLAARLGYPQEETGQVSPVEPVQEAEYYHLSHAQKRLWILSQAEGGSAAYNIPGAYALQGAIDIPAFRKAFGTLVARHEILRTTFQVAEGEPKQKVHPPAGFPFEVEMMDLSGEEEKSKEEKCRAITDYACKSNFDMRKGPLMRAILLKTEHNRFLFVFVMHHIISDGWSMKVLVREVLALYEFFSIGIGVLPAPLRIQYKDFAYWQHAQLAGEQTNVHKQYWSRKLGGSLPVLTLPADFSRPSQRSYRGGSVRLHLPDTLCKDLRRISTGSGVTLFVTLLAAVKALLYRSSGQNDIIIGTPVAGRDHSDLENQIGFYINNLALRTSVEGEETFRDLLGKVRSTVMEAFAHQVYPFDLLLEDLNLSRSTSRFPLFDVVVFYNPSERGSGHEAGTPQVEVSGVEMDSVSIDTDLKIVFSDSGDSMIAGIDYSTDLFRRETIEAFAAKLLKLIETVSADTSVRICDVELDASMKEPRTEAIETQFNF